MGGYVGGGWALGGVLKGRCLAFSLRLSQKASRPSPL